MGDRDKQKSRIGQQTSVGSYPRTLVIFDLRRDEDFAEYERETRNALERGDKAALLHFVSTCFSTGRTVPGWAQQKFQDDVNKAGRCEIKSWEEVFGRPLEKGKQLATERRRMTLGPKIWKRVGELHEAGEPISKGLFETVGEELGIGGTAVADLYYEKQTTIRNALTSKNPELQRAILEFFGEGLGLPDGWVEAALDPKLRVKKLKSLARRAQPKLNSGKI